MPDNKLVDSTVAPRGRRRGLGAVEVIVIVGILGFAAILFTMGLSKGRESSRMAGCQRNLMQVGVGLQMYHQANRHYPTVSTLDRPGEGPIKTLLDAFVIPDLLELRDPSNPPRPTQSPPPGVNVPGLTCPSDRNMANGPLVSSLSYRFNTGDEPEGSNGPFQPGRVMTSAEIESSDGLSYTAAVAERLVGDGRDGHPALGNYATCPAPVTRSGCPSSSPGLWRGDAGSDWAEASWRSSLYNHVLTPNAGPSCIAQDGRTGLMGASSAHVGRVNVLIMDGSLRVVKPSVDSKVWAELGTVGSSSPPPAP